jgi:indole-3-glycerol phosphate synthase
VSRSSILATILEHKAEELAAARRRRSTADLAAACDRLAAPRSLRAALRCDRRGAGETVRIIAEIKRASPSAGPIRPGADPVDIARRYTRAGAHAISVLTDERFFDGHLEFLGRVRAATELPLLRKDFLIDPYQVLEARAAGADAVLLIVAALDDHLLRTLLDETRRLGMDALVEVHDEAEAERAVAAGADLVGVNHRDLRTFTMDMGLTGRLRALVPSDTVLVGESGIRSAADVVALGRAGADAVLVGETLMRAEDPGAALGALLAGG